MFLSLVLHNHQPVGQLPWAFEDAWRESYQPFLETLGEFSAVKIGLHFSGPLLDWLAAEKPETITLVRALVACGQIEVLCGGYYEPIFAIWPREDALSQIEISKRRVRELFGVKAHGLWLTERVWEPQLAEWFCAAGIDYTVLDSMLFEAAGIDEAHSHAVFQIKNSMLRVFPINNTLRGLIPWREPHETTEYLRRAHEANGADAHVLFGDDGEKFGAWPGTFHWVFEKGWLRRFFQSLQRESGWLQTVTPWEYSSKRGTIQSVELESGSYPEMQEWSGGNWRNFLDRYHESRDMHEEVLRARQLVSGAAKCSGEARNHILRAQSNDAYWHGVFGGLYLKHLRQAVYAECAEARELCAADEIQLEENGENYILDNSILGVGARAHGGHLFMLSSTPARHNLLATLRRYTEPYYSGSTPADWYPRGALLDHFFGSDVTLEDFQHSRFQEEGDFISENWEVVPHVETTSGVLLMRRSGGVWHDGVFAPLAVEKKITLPRDSSEMHVEYSFKNPGEAPLELWWGIEWNAVLSGVDLPERHYHADNHKEKLSLEKAASFEAVSNPIMADNWLGLWLEWEFPQSVALWHAPIETVSQKEGGHSEQIYQQSAFVFHQRLKLESGEQYRTDFRVLVTDKPRVHG